MPSQLPSSFASAAAGQSSRDSRGGRDGRGGGSGEWSRRDGRSTNGTMTFRRSSTTPFNNQSTSQPPPPADGPAPQAQPTPADAVPFDGSLRYTKEQLLEIYKVSDTGTAANVESLFVAGWTPAPVSGSAARNWGKGNESHVPQDPSVCWDTSGTVKPIGLQDMSAEEKEVRHRLLFNSDVNSTIKPPQQNKDGPHQGGGLNGRKASVSHGSAFVTSSPSTASRPGTRRRETGDASPFPVDGLVSPTGNRFARGDSSSWFGRRSLEEKEDTFEEPAEDLSAINREAPPSRSTGFGALSRSNTAGTTGSGASGFANLWGAPSAPAAGPSAMGSFGNFSMTASAIGDKRFTGARESRLAHLIPKDNAASPVDGSSFPPKGNEAAAAEPGRSWRPRPRTDTDPFGEDSGNLGSLREGTSPSPQQVGGPRGTIFETPVKGSAGDFGMSGLNLGGQKEETGTPETNPYRSPPAERGDDEAGGGDFGPGHTHGQGADQPSGFGAIARGFAAANIEGSAGDRSQTSSVGANKGFHPLNTLTGWPSGLTSGTPDRERSGFPNPFGNSIFSPDIQSPAGGLSGIGNVFSPASAGGSLRGGSKLGSLFPAAMQAQMQVPDHEGLADPLADFRQVNPLGAIGRSATGPQPRETDSPLRGGRSGMFEELFPTSDAARAQGLFSTAEPSQGLTSTSQSQPFAAVTSTPSFPGMHAQSDTPPSQTQARTMVMPDRMRWVYLDPQGSTQGPFTGLEMNDWYKANFFTPDLRVKRIEDDDFEPLGQLIRRIGNSREPFLVPQIGVAHGPPSQAGPFSQGDARGVIPPLVGAFPSFGRTLTAEEQNNLERRKQEEQFLMHRQREFMAQQQQVFTKMAMQGGAPGVLHHHSSAHSLQSQPSFSSMTSPIGMPPQATIGTIGAPAVGPSYFDGTTQGLPQSGLTAAPTDIFQNDLNVQERQMLVNLQGGAGVLPNILQSQRLAAGNVTSAPSNPSLDASLRSQLPGVDQLQQDSQGFSARLKEFQEIRAQRDAEESGEPAAATAKPISPDEATAEETATKASAPQDAAQIAEEVAKAQQDQNKKAAAQAQAMLSLTQQVQKTQAAAAKQAQPLESGILMPFPPPAGAPLAAPTAQRTRSTLPDQFAVSRSHSGTPESATQTAPPLAPWARAEPEQQKGPNFREIQEAEAKKSARAEIAAAAARRAVLEQEAALAREREKTAVSGAAPILPTSSTWGSGSPVTPSASASAWAKPAAGGAKGGNATPITGPTAAATNAERKKTLAEIQREEEVRKQRLAKAQEQAAAATAAAIINNNNMGKRYADLASKVGQPGGAPVSAAAAVAGGPPGAGWATVGAGGKVKVPTGPSGQQQAVRTASSGAAKPATTVVATKPVLSRPSVTPAAKPDTLGAAMEEFNKWLRRELGRGIASGIDIDTFASTLLVLPLDQTLISDAVYASSTTMDGRHFAEEFVRRKKLADKGVVEKQPAGGRGGASGPGASSATNSDKGWSEVAKKSSGGAAATNGGNTGSEGAIQGAGFKVVPGRKRGKK
ncbi:hypothetical protein RB598_001099 [Gaeumannomyces tritici]